MMGLGMKVAVLPKLCAVFHTTYFKSCVQSARFTKVANFVPISICEPVPTSLWCTSTGMPMSSSRRTMAERKSCPASTGATGA